MPTPPLGASSASAAPEIEQGKANTGQEVDAAATGNLRAHRRVRRYALATTVSILALVLVAYGMLRAAMAYIGDPPLSAVAHLLEDDLGLDAKSDRTGDAVRTATERRLVEPEDVDPLYLAMLLTFEDRRFYSHFGVDLYALARSALELVQYRRIVSGGSTLTMQVARILENQYKRAPSVKARQILRAIQLERQLSKRDILRLYLNLAPFGGRIKGVRAASLAYFGKEPQRLTVGEAALLVALPQAPELRRLDRYAANARRARDFVLRTMANAGVLSPAEAELARLETVAMGGRQPTTSLISFGE